MIWISPELQEGRTATRHMRDIPPCRQELKILILNDLDISGSSRGQSCQDHEYGSLED
jgi:hypothetical protein